MDPMCSVSGTFENEMNSKALWTYNRQKMNAHVYLMIKSLCSQKTWKLEYVPKLPDCCSVQFWRLLGLILIMSHVSSAYHMFQCNSLFLLYRCFCLFTSSHHSLPACLLVNSSCLCQLWMQFSGVYGFGSYASVSQPKQWLRKLLTYKQWIENTLSVCVYGAFCNVCIHIHPSSHAVGFVNRKWSNSAPCALRSFIFHAMICIWDAQLRTKIKVKFPSLFFHFCFKT